MNYVINNIQPEIQKSISSRQMSFSRLPHPHSRTKGYVSEAFDANTIYICEEAE